MTTSDFIKTCQHLDVSPFRVVTCEVKTGRCHGLENSGKFITANPLAVRKKVIWLDLKLQMKGPEICPGCMTVGAHHVTAEAVADMAEALACMFADYRRESVISG